MRLECNCLSRSFSTPPVLFARLAGLRPPLLVPPAPFKRELPRGGALEEDPSFGGESQSSVVGLSGVVLAVRGDAVDEPGWGRGGPVSIESTWW